MTDYERDKKWEQSEWWRVPAMACLFPALVLLMWGTR